MTKKPTDFNDMAAEKGPAPVKAAVASVIDAAKGRPFGQFIVRPDGTYQQTIDRKTGEAEEFYLCTRLEPLGIARTSSGSDFTLVLKMTNLDGQVNEWLLTQEAIFRAGGEECRVDFVRRGGAFGPGTRERSAFADLLKSFVRHPRHLPRITLADRTGWINNGTAAAFVLPAETIGILGKERVLLPDPGHGAPNYATAGTLASWQEHIGRLCRGNSRLMFACALALAAPLLHLRGLGGGGFNLVGPSSCGKTSALHVAASVSGAPAGLLRTCDSTANAFESTAGQHSDSALLLDELGQAHPEAIGQIVYKLAGGIGRGRADHHGNARDRRQWRILFLCTGETDLASMMQTTGRRAHTGQELRLADIEADVGIGHGIFETIHSFTSAAELADHLRDAASKHHGHLLHDYLTRLVEEVNDPARKSARLQWIAEVEQTFMARVLPPGASGQVCRVAARFALVAAGGELGSHYQLTGWHPGEVLDAAVACFESWLTRRGTAGMGEVDQLLRQVSGFFERFGESRFQKMETKTRGTPPPNRAGFSRAVHLGDTLDPDATAFEFFVLPSVFKEELCTGFDSRWSAQILIDRGLLQPGNDGKAASVHWLPGLGKSSRCYHFPAPSQAAENPPPAEKNIRSPF